MFTLQKSHTLKHRNLDMHHFQEGYVALARPCPSKAETQNPSLPWMASTVLQLQRERTPGLTSNSASRWPVSGWSETWPSSATATFQHEDSWRDCRSEKGPPKPETGNRQINGDVESSCPSSWNLSLGQLQRVVQDVHFLLKLLRKFFPIVLSLSPTSPCWF